MPFTGAEARRCSSAISRLPGDPLVPLDEGLQVREPEGHRLHPLETLTPRLRLRVGLDTAHRLRDGAPVGAVRRWIALASSFSRIEVREVLRRRSGSGEVRGQVVLEDLVVQAHAGRPSRIRSIRSRPRSLSTSPPSSRAASSRLRHTRYAASRSSSVHSSKGDVRQPGQADPPGVGEGVLRQVLVQVEEAGEVLAANLAAVREDREDDRQAGEDR